MGKHHIILLAGILSATFSFSQDDTVRTSSLDEVVVSASKFPMKTSATGKVITVISRQQLERAGAKDLSQVLNEQVGLYLNGANSSPGKDRSIFLRGAKVEHTLVTVDGVPMYDASGIGNNFDIRQIPVEMVERIEILKGSQSTLYGSDAIAGVINIITRRPGNKKPSAYGTLSYGSFKTFRGNIGVQGSVGKFDYQAGYNRMSTEGIDETVDTVKSGIRDKDGFEQSGYQAQIGYRPADAIYLRGYMRYAKTDADIDQQLFTDERDYTSTLKNLQAGIRSEIGLGTAKLNILYNFTNTDRLYTDDSVLSRNGFYSYSRGTYKSKEHYAEAFVSAPLAKLLKFTGGVDYRRSTTEQEYANVAFGTPGKSLLGGDSVKHSQFGLYAALVAGPFKGFHMEAGARLNNHSEYGSHFVYNVNPSYLIRERVKLFFNLSTGYRTPSLYQLFSEYGNRDLEPESSLNLEAGVQFLSKSGIHSERITVFRRRVKDVHFFYFNPVTFESQYINQDRQTDEGIEAEVKLQLNDKLGILLTYTYVDGEVTTKLNGVDTSYWNLIRRPRNTFNASVSYQVTPQLLVSSHVQAIGKRFDWYFDPNTFRTKETTLKSFVLLGFYAEYGFLKNRVKLFADLRNVLDEDYMEVYGYASQGFNAYGGIRFSF